VKEEKECPNVSVKEEQVEDQKENQKQAAPFEIFVKDLKGVTHSVIIGANNTVGDLKVHLVSKTKIPFDEQRLIFAGKQLEDGRTMSDYNVKEGSTIDLVIRLRGC